MSHHKPGLVCSFVSFLIYINTFHADFVYDDRRAIVQNPDVTLQTPLSSLLFRDYWGTPLNHSGSHGSYRPLTVLSFRLNYLFFGLQPCAYHVTNVMLHCITTYLFCVVLKKVMQMSSKNSYIAGLLFALHPIHTEAVAGVVGRADILATLFCLLTLLAYRKSCEDLLPVRDKRRSTNWQSSSTSKIHTLTHRNSKSVRKRLKKRNQKKYDGSKNESKIENHHSVNFDDVLSFKSNWRDNKTLDTGSISDHSNVTTDTCDSLASSTASSLNAPANDRRLTHEDFDDIKQSAIEQRFPVQNACNNAFYKNHQDKLFNSVKKTDLQNDSGRIRQSTSKYQHRSHQWLVLSFLASTCAILSKENGYCALPICIVYDLLTHQLLEKLQSPIKFLQNPNFSQVRKRILIVLAFWIGLMAFRVGLPLSMSQSGGAFPKFSPSDNPTAACSDFLTRTLTFNYLLTCHLQMLFFPVSLSFDWSMDSIPLISSITDIRNLATLAMYLSVVVALKFAYASIKQCSRQKSTSSADIFTYFDGQIEDCKPINRRLSNASSEESFDLPLDDNGNIITDKKARKGLKQRTWKTKRGVSDLVHNNSTAEHSSVVRFLFGSAVMALALIPATNLFFYVGFVLAERLLYLPSIGTCILMVEAADFFTGKLFEKIKSTPRARWFSTRKRERNGKVGTSSLMTKFSSLMITHVWLVLLLGYFSIRTANRNMDWKNETTLYRSGLAINPAKALANLGNTLRSQDQLIEAEQAYIDALGHRPNMADTHYNLGLLYQETGRHKMAEESYRRAILFRPAMAVAHLNLGVVLVEQHKPEEAKTVYRHAATLENLETKDPMTHANAQISALFNLGCLLADEGHYKGAVDVLQEAVSRPLDYYKPHSLYNMLGQSLFHLNRFNEAERWFQASLASNPGHVPAHLAYARLLAKQGHNKEAQQLYERALKWEPENKEVYKHYSNFLHDIGQHYKAAEILTLAAEASFGKNDYETIFSAASAYRQAKVYIEAEKYYEQAVKLKPKLAASHLNLGAIYHLQGKYELAKISYHRALVLQPGNTIVQQNLSKLMRSVELKPPVS